MRVRLQRKVNVFALSEETKLVKKFLFLPILTDHPLQLIWWEWITFEYCKAIGTDKFIKVGTYFHGYVPGDKEFGNPFEVYFQ